MRSIGELLGAIVLLAIVVIALLALAFYALLIAHAAPAAQGDPDDDARLDDDDAGGYPYELDPRIDLSRVGDWSNPPAALSLRLARSRPAAALRERSDVAAVRELRPRNAWLADAAALGAADGPRDPVVGVDQVSREERMRHFR